TTQFRLSTHRPDRYALMMNAEDFFHRMRKRRVADVVEQRRYPRSDTIVRRNAIALAQSIENASYQMQRAETVSEARMFSALVSIKTEAELFDSTQTLKFRRVDQTNYQTSLFTIVAKR